MVIMAPKLFNSLPENLKEVSLQTIKRGLDEYLRSVPDESIVAEYQRSQPSIIPTARPTNSSGMATKGGTSSTGTKYLLKAIKGTKAKYKVPYTHYLLRMYIRYTLKNNFVYFMRSVHILKNDEHKFWHIFFYI